MHLSPRASDALLLVGALSVASLAWRGAKLLYRVALRGSCCGSKGLQVYQTSPPGNAWAAVTGSTEGIGRAFCFELARRGFHLLLVGRNAEKLQALAGTIRATHPQTITRIVVSDAAATGAEGLEAVEAVRAAAAEVPLRLLMNNVGTITESRFVAQTSAQVQEMLQVNAMYTTMLTHALLPQLQREASATPQNRTGIMNVSSLCGVFPMPFLSVYSATKSYVIALSHALRTELAHDLSVAGGSGRVDVSAFTPARVCTRMTGISEPSFLVPTPEAVARAALDEMGNRDLGGVRAHRMLLEIGGLFDDDTRGKLEYQAQEAEMQKKAAKMKQQQQEQQEQKQ